MTAWRINGRDVPEDVLKNLLDDALPPHRAVKTAKGVWIYLKGRSYFLESVRVSRSSVSGGGSSDGIISSPMPGKIFKVSVKNGEVVTTGQELVVLEAMKMEHVLRAPCDGKVADLKVSPGDLVESGQALAKVTGGS